MQEAKLQGERARASRTGAEAEFKQAETRAMTAPPEGAAPAAPAQEQGISVDQDTAIRAAAQRLGIRLGNTGSLVNDIRSSRMTPDQRQAFQQYISDLQSGVAAR
jgi:hypothetical protein